LFSSLFYLALAYYTITHSHNFSLSLFLSMLLLSACKLTVFNIFCFALSFQVASALAVALNLVYVAVALYVGVTVTRMDKRDNLLKLLNVKKTEQNKLHSQTEHHINRRDMNAVELTSLETIPRVSAVHHDHVHVHVSSK